MSRKTQQMYRTVYVKVFDKIQALAPQFAPQCTMEEASVLGLQQVFASTGVVGCRPSLSSPAISVDQCGVGAEAAKLHVSLPSRVQPLTVHYRLHQIRQAHTYESLYN